MANCSSSYDRYKRDTNYVANWLAQTAKQRGFGFPVINKQIDVNARQRSLLPARQFPLLASQIAKVRPPVYAPASLLSALKHAIAARQESYDYHVSRPSINQRQEGDEEHQYFINVLKSTLSRIKTCQRPSCQRKSFRTSPAATKSSNDSLFVAIKPVLRPGRCARSTIAEPEEEEEEQQIHKEESPSSRSHSQSQEIAASPSSSPEPAKESGTDNDIEAETMTDVIETFTIVQCLLADVEEIRIHVLDTWTRYANSNIDLITAAVTVNTAIAIVQRLENNFIADFPNEDLRKWQDAVFEHECSINGKDPDEKERPQDLFNYDCYQYWEKALLLPYSLMENLRNTSKKGVPISEEADAITRSSSSQMAKTGRQKYEKDHSLLMQLTSPFCMLLSFPAGVPAADGLTEGLKSLRNGGKMSLWLAFAAQCYLEAHHALHDNIDRPFRELQRLALATRHTAVETLKCHAKARWYNNPLAMEYGMYCTMVSSVDDFVSADFCRNWCQLSCPDYLEKLAPPFYVLKNHPLVAGMWAYRIAQSAYEVGIEHGACWQSFLHGAHLYNAITQDGVCKEPWHGMQRFMSCFSDKELYSGKRPQTPREYQLRAMLMMGWSSRNFASGKDDPLQYWKKQVKLTQRIPLSFLLGDWLIDNGPVDTLNSHLGRIESLLNEKNANKSARPWAATRAGSTELLQLLIVEMQSKMPRLKFDLLALHRQTWACLRRLDSVFHSTLVAIGGPECLPIDESNLFMIVNYIFDIALGTSSRLRHNDRTRLPRMIQDTIIPQMLSDKIMSMTGAIVEQVLKDQNEHRSSHPLAGRYDDPTVELKSTDLAQIPELRKLYVQYRAMKSLEDIAQIRSQLTKAELNELDDAEVRLRSE